MSVPLCAMAIAAGQILWPAAGAAQEQPASARALAVGAVEQDSLAPGVVHRWTMEVQKGDYIRVEVEQQGVDLMVRLLDPADSLKAEFDSPTGNSGKEEAEWVAGVAGRWTAELVQFEGSPAGGYTIEWTVGRPATEEERLLQEADSLGRLGYSLLEQGDPAAATPLLSRALEIRTGILPKTHPDVDLTLTMLGAGYRMEGRPADAERVFQTALEYRESIPDPAPPDLVFSLRMLGSFYGSEGRFTEAVPLIRRALDIQMEAFGPDDLTAADLMHELGRIYQEQGRYTDAEPLLERALQIMTVSLGPEDPAVAGVLSNLGTLYQDLGQYGRAEILYRRALAIRETLGEEHPDLAVSLNNLGALFHEQGLTDEAERLYRRSLAIREKALGSDHPAVATALSNLGNLLDNLGRFREAEQMLRRALEIREGSRWASQSDIAIALNNLAMILESQGKLTGAKPLLERALGIWESELGLDHPYVARALLNLAKVAIAEEELQAAGELASRAVTILDGSAGRPDWRVEAYALRARVLKLTGDSVGAMEDLEEALRSAEELRPQAGGGEEVRATYFARYADAFDRMVGWQLGAGRIEEAFEYAERGRARVLLDQLAAGRINLRAGIPPEQLADLEIREKDAAGRLAEFQQRITLTRARRDLTNSERLRSIAGLKDSLASADAEYRRIYGEIKNASPLWQDLITSGGQPVSLRTAQRELVPENGALLLYQIGGEASFLIFIPPAGGEPQAFELLVGEAEAGVLGVGQGPVTDRVLDDILAGSDPNAPGASLLEKLRQSNESGALEALHALWQVLVPEPLRGRLLEASQVVVVPDGRLHQLPFEALVLDMENGAEGAGVRYWLDDGPVIRYAASASTLYNLARRPAARSFGGSSEVLSVSNPIFDPLAASAPPTRAIPSGSATAPSRSVYQRAGGSLAPLPGTARETAAIDLAFEDDMTVTLIALQGARATEANVRDAIEDKRYLHLATHGLVDQKRGALFAALAFTPPADTSPAGANDGFLQLFEIYNLELSGTDLAVLSACESSIGERVPGEGVFALSRGFFAAGARRVVASLWAVDDASTAALMAEFFRQIAEAEQAGNAVDYAAALRNAKRTLSAKERWSSPYYWAPFILAGPS